ncbi:MAG: ATP-dependent helicase HrpB [Rhodospirillaceae bacterium]|nr:ATP-dependent helicase HrpB [Rhodospirillaceae bacterium]
MMLPLLPITPILPLLAESLTSSPNAVLLAPPGAGKTTAAPLHLLDAPWLEGRKLVMLEPRRLSARAAASRMAQLLGEPIGGRVGYRMRQDNRIGPATRIEVVTEGVLTRMLQDDPELSGVGLVLFDEFHERSLNADIGLALCLDIQAALRNDLRLLVMSATLDGGPISRLMGDAPIITAEGRSFPVAIRWLDRPWTGRVEDGVVRLAIQALEENPDGDILVFLPGQAEIRRAERALAAYVPFAEITPLFGDLPQAEQERALRPVPGRRRIVLASAIAETSLTIEGVRIVVDGGRSRQSRFDLRTGMSRLVTVPVSKASAEQRRGRAGRLAPGLCYRLWTEAEHRALPAFAAPEIAEADLAPLALELGCWGIDDPNHLSWLDDPPQSSLLQARDLLRQLGALDQDGRITSHGRAMARLGLHPRLAHMALKATAIGLGGLGADIAALLSERDLPMAERDADFRQRLALLKSKDGSAVLRRVREASKRLRRLLGASAHETDAAGQAGLLIAFAYPERIAMRRGASSLHYRMANGQGAFFTDPESLCREDMLAIATLDGNRRDSRIFLAAPLSRTEIEEHFADAIEISAAIAWDERGEQISAVRERRLGRLVLSQTPLDDPDPNAMTQAMLEGVRILGLSALPWTADSLRLRMRVGFLRRLDGDGGSAWPDLSDDALSASLDQWLAPWLQGCTRKSHLARLDMTRLIAGLLDWRQTSDLDRLAPSHLTVPSGSRIAIDYEPDKPVLAVRLQEMFGLAETPKIAGGKAPLLLHLLSPARRPVQVTQDLAGFWAGSYAAVRSELAGHYPKHYWPADPMQAEPTARAKPRR